MKSCRYQALNHLRTVLVVFCCMRSVCPAEDLVIWHDRPALDAAGQADWLRAFPIGNGSLGGMVHGHVGQDEVQLNLDTLYALEPDTACFVPELKDLLPPVRAWLAAGHYEAAERFIERNWLGRSNAPYVTLGSLWMECHDQTAGKSHYRKQLDLSTAIVTTEYQLDGIRYRREYFSSYPDRAIVVRVTADQPGRISTTLRLTTPHAPTTTSTAERNTLLMRGQGPGEAFRRKLEDKVEWEAHKYPAFFEKGSNGTYRIKDRILALHKGNGENAGNILYGTDVDGRGMYFAAQLRVKADGGSVRAEAGALRVEGADALTLVLCADTSFNGQHNSPSREGRDPVALVQSLHKKIGAIDYAALRKRHVEDYQSLFRRLGLELGREDPAKRALPTDRRISEYGAHSDPSLVALLYQFSRYLCIAGSRPGSQPLGLQGLWNKHVIPPWNGAYTVNINAEMNYWNVLRGNLAELHEPFLRAIAECVPNGRKVAREMYGLDGWCLHHNISIWRSCAPVDGRAGDGARTSFWNMGAGWFLQHVWEHYLFTQDATVLEAYYPAMLEAARFYSQWLEDRGDGVLWTPVGTSPENAFLVEGTKAAVSPGPTLDMAIIRECFTNLLTAAEILQREDPLLDTIRTQLPRLLPYQVGRYGQLQEWSTDYEEEDPAHRHLSHLYGFFPGQDELTRNGELIEAVRTTMLRRGSGGMGWSMGWKLCIWARLGEPDRFMDQLARLMSPAGIADNMFGLGPPFQIDANFGAARGIAECLVQDYAGEVILLPALPAQWSTGAVRGMVVKGNHELDLKWAGGDLSGAVLRSRSGLPVTVRYREHTAQITPTIGESIDVFKALFSGG